MLKIEKFFFVTSIVWALLALTAVLHNQLFAEVRLFHVTLIHVATAGVALMSAVVLWSKYMPAVSILRIMIYVVMLAQGALIIYSIESIFSLPGFVVFACSLVFIFYMFGFRVYLTSSEARQYFSAK